LACGAQFKRVALAGLAMLVVVSGAEAGRSYAAAPRGFVGVNAEDVYAGTDAYREQMLSRMAANGITSIRQIFRWRYTEPQDGVYDWTQLDAMMRAATQHNIGILPLIGGETTWGSSRPPGNEARCLYPPRNNADFADWVKQLVHRYGRGGDFWALPPQLTPQPLTAYEIWNEPNVGVFWACQPNARAYVRLARVAANAIHSIDPRATIVSGGAPRRKAKGKYLRAMFRAGAARVFDALSLHLYESSARATLDILREARRFLNTHGARRWRIYLTEYGWATAGPKSDHTVSEAKQARLVKSTLMAVRRNRKELKIASTDYYTWHDLPPPVDYGGGADYWGLHTGLLRIDDTPKPALGAMRQAAQ
jgi:polysaccharide biosynthesis protein PslG